MSADQTPPDVEAIRARLDAATCTAEITFDNRGGDGEFFKHAPTDLRRLLDENARLNAELHGRRNLGVEYERLRVENIQLRDENDDMRKRVAFAAAVVSGDAAEMLAESLKKVRSDLAARDRTVEALSARLTAKNAELDECIRAMRAASVKLEARNNEITRMGKEIAKANEAFAAIWAEINTWDLTDEQIGEQLENIGGLPRVEGWIKFAVKRGNAKALKAILEPAPEMPRPPAEEAPTCFAPYGSTETACGDSIPKQTPWKFLTGDWDSPALTVRKDETTCPACISAKEPLREAAQERAGDTDTSPAGSGRGTGELKAENSAQESEDHEPRAYRLGSLINLTCSCEEFAVSFVNGTNQDEMDDKFAEHLAEVEDEPEADLSLIPADLIKSDPGIRGGEPCITGTRIPAHEVAGYLADGATWDEVREMLPSLPSLPVPSTGEER